MTGCLDLARRALAMHPDDATTLTTLDEPELILQPGAPPIIDPLDLAAARLRDAWTVGEMLNDPATAAAMRLAAAGQQALNRAVLQ